MTHDAKKHFAAVQLAGGLAVLGSYAWGIGTHPEDAHLLWGTIPESWWLPYSACMPPAAIGYLAATWHVWRSAETAQLRRMTTWYAGFLVASTAWMPLCFAALERGSTALEPLIQGVLLVAAGCALGVGNEIRRGPERGRTMALTGWAALCWQCVILDALVWPRFFAAAI